MCQSCFSEDWDLTNDDGDELPDVVEALANYLGSLPPDRREAIERCYRLTVQHQVAHNWMGGLLHAAIDDDNYDCGTGGKATRDEWRARWLKERGVSWNRPELDPEDPYGQTASVDDEDAVCDAWDALTEQERSLVVAWRCSYRPFLPDPEAVASLPPERHGHLPAPPWETPLAFRNGNDEVCATLNPGPGAGIQTPIPSSVVW